MGHIKCLCVALALTVAAGCNAVLVDEPMGATPVSVEADEWVGHWIGQKVEPGVEPGAVTVSIEVVDAEGGVLRATWLERGDAKVTRVYLRESGDWTFASVPVPEGFYDISPGGFDFGLDEQIDSSEEAQYVWARVSKEDQAFVFWEPDVDKFRQLVTEGSVPGRLTDPNSPNRSDVVLDHLEPEHYDLLASDQAGIPFEWDEPGVLIRVAR